MEQIIAALDLGTSKTIALVVQKDFWGKLSVLQSESLPSKDAIRRGRIFNSDETSEIISKLTRKLNGNSTSKIEKIYVGIGGQSLHTQLFSVKKTVEGGTVSRQLLESIEEEAKNYKPEFEENLGAFSCDYYVDGHLVLKPQGAVASVIEARFQLIVGNPCLKLNLEKVFRGKDIAVAGYFVSPIATAEAVLTQEEKESGCALVEWGEGVTYVSVYKNKSLKYLATLPLGGLAITLDIRSLNVSDEEAEALKIKYGSAIQDTDDSNEVPVNEGQSLSRKIELKYLNWIIEARVDEIVKNILNQIQLSGYSQSLNAGIVITGGGALLRNLPQYLRNKTGKEVRLANTKVWINQVETQLSPSESCVAGLAKLGKENCGKASGENVKLPPPDGNVNLNDKDNKTEDKKDKNLGNKQIDKQGTSSGFLGIRKLGKKTGKTFNRLMEDMFKYENDESINDTSQPVGKESTANQQNEENSDNETNKE